MQEYLDMGHMTEIKDTDIDNKQTFRVYLPHHAVIRESSETTKLRCVLDASCKSDHGISLNDCLMTGPVVQDELFDIILDFAHTITFLLPVCAKCTGKLKCPKIRDTYKLLCGVMTLQNLLNILN